MAIKFKQNYAIERSLEFRLKDFSQKMKNLSFVVEHKNNVVYFKRFERPINDISDKLALIRLIQFNGKVDFENDNFMQVYINLNRQILIIIIGFTLPSIVFFLIKGLNIFILLFWLCSILLALLVSYRRAISLVKSCLQ